jgi:hypothetical protein
LAPLYQRYSVAVTVQVTFCPTDAFEGLAEHDALMPEAWAGDATRKNIPNEAITYPKEKRRDIVMDYV